MLTSVVVIIIAKRKIKNFEEEGVIYTILIANKHRILLELKRVARYLLDNIISRLAYLAIIVCYCGIICFYYIMILLYYY